VIGMTVCSVEGCNETAHVRGWCRKHYGRWQRNGDPVAGRTAKGEPLAWLKRAVHSAREACIEWPFNRDRDGYGRVRFAGRFQRAGHVALELAGQRRPSATHQALHQPALCHNSKCINPHHLRWGLPRENTADRMVDGTAALRAKNPAAKLSEEQVALIKADTRKHALIAADFGVSRSQVSRIKNGSAWK
jgi:hypothetical protein